MAADCSYYRGDVLTSPFYGHERNDDDSPLGTPIFAEAFQAIKCFLVNRDDPRQTTPAMVAFIIMVVSVAAISLRTQLPQNT